MPSPRRAVPRSSFPYRFVSVRIRLISYRLDWVHSTTLSNRYPALLCFSVSRPSLSFPLPIHLPPSRSTPFPFDAKPVLSFPLPFDSALVSAVSIQRVGCHLCSYQHVSLPFHDISTPSHFRSRHSSRRIAAASPVLPSSVPCCVSVGEEGRVSPPRPPPRRSDPCRCCATGTGRAGDRSPATRARSPRPSGSSRGR